MKARSNYVTAAMPDGWWLERDEALRGDGSVSRVKYEIYEDGGPVWKESGEPRPALDVEVWPPETRFGELAPAKVSWPGTSDKRPVLARALAEALRLAAEEALKLDEAAGL